jgi:DNA replication protein DnaC
VIYREAHTLIDQVAEAAIDGTRKTLLAELTAVPLLIIDDLGMRKLPHTAAEDLLELIMRRYERASTLLTSNHRSTTGASCSATPPPSPRSSIGSYITRTS